VYVGDLNKLFVANGTDGKLRIYDGDSFKLLNSLDVGEDADNVRYDPAQKKSKSPMEETRRVALP
jgi:hypothetical protein